MKKIKKIKKEIGRMLPERVKELLRTAMKAASGTRGNPDIPVEELRIFNLLKEEMHVVFDVGAREDLLFYNIKKDCAYHLFEPSTKAIASLKKQIATLGNHNITLNEFGLSDKHEDDCVYYENSQSFVINPFHKGIDTGTRYSLKRLDDYVTDKQITSIDFLKIDAEGMDYKIIRGGEHAVKTIVSYIQFEYWDGVQKFVAVLGDTFNLYLMIEPRLLEAITDDAREHMTESQKQKNYALSVIPLDDDVIDLIDRVLAPMGYGGNILGIKKTIDQSMVQKIMFGIEKTLY
jgi:FkbM family methyltransferase